MEEQGWEGDLPAPGRKRRRDSEIQAKGGKRLKVSEEAEEHLEEWLVNLVHTEKTANLTPLQQLEFEVIERYGMLSDVEAGLVRLQEVINGHNEQTTNLTGEGNEELVMGSFHLRGFLVEVDEERAVELWRAAVARGNLQAMYCLGRLLAESPPGISLREGESPPELFMRAAEGGHSSSQHQMGVIYEESGEMEKAAFYFQSASDGGHADAPFRLGKMIEAGKVGVSAGEEKVQKTAIELFRLAAERNCPEANFHLGQHYLEKSRGGVEETNEMRELAQSYLSDAAVTGHLEAQFILAFKFGSEAWQEELESHFDQFKSTYEEEAERGDAEAQYKMGMLYQGAESADAHVAAIAYLEKAAAQGHPEAQLKAGEAHMNGQGTEQDFKKAVEFFRLAAREDEAHEAYLMLGELHERGDGVERDTDEAARLYEKAFSLGVEGALDALKELHKRGEGWQGCNKEMVDSYDRVMTSLDAEIWHCDQDREAFQILGGVFSPSSPPPTQNTF